LLLLIAAFGGLAWLAWEQRDVARVSRAAVLTLSGGLLLIAVLAPPTESHDVWSYVMIGRTAAVHHSDPYQHPSSAFRDDPFRLRVDPVWRHSRSVYGPVFVALAAATVKVTGDSPWRGRVAFQLLAALAVLASLIVVDRVTRGDPRALAFIGLNALVVVVTVNNAHNDAFVGLAVLGAVVLARRRPAMAGLVLGVAALIKIAAVLPAGVLALWLFRHQARRAAYVLGGVAAAVTAAGYAAAGPASVTVLSTARDRMNRGAIWYPVREFVVHLQTGSHATSKALQAARDTTGPRLSTLSTVAVIALAVLIVVRAKREPAVVVAAAVLAYAVLGAYIFPWYLVWGVPVLALAWRSRMAWLAIALAGALELGFVPDERRIGLNKAPAVHTLLQRAQLDFRIYVVPLISLAAVVALVVWSARGAGRVELERGATETGSDTPPGHEAEGFDDRAARELRSPGNTVGEDDRHLADHGADQGGPVHGLDLEGVPVGLRVGEADAADEVSAIHAEPSGDVGDVAAQD
jgi:hypothetical protein